MTKNIALVCHTHQKDHDSLKLLQSRIKKLDIGTQGRWVKRHQDDNKRHKDLDWWDRINVRCDQLAKVHLSNPTNVNPRPPPHKGQFPLENTRLFVKDGKLTGMRKTEIHNAIAFNNAIDHWVKRERTMAATVLLIHLDVMGDAMEKLTLAKRKWITKCASENCGIGKTLC